MLIHTKTVRIGNKEVVIHTPVREHWHEWFRIIALEGECRAFYFPIDRIYVMNAYVCWVWYLVPFVLPIKLFWVAFMTILKDCRELLLIWKENLNK